MKNIKYVDGHCHFNHKNIKTLLKAAKDKISSLMAIIDIADDNIDKLIEQLESEQEIKIYIALGCHPNSVKNLDFNLMKERFDKYINRIHCIGEIGLDFFKSENIQQQKKFLKYQCNLAQKHKKPINIHARGCNMDELLEIIQNNKGITIHCCTFNWKNVQKALKIGAYISFSGIVTFKKKVDDIKEACLKTPIEKLLIETDSPYLAPVPMRGKINECSMIVHTYDYISQLRKIPLEELKNIVTKNLHKSLKV